MGEDIMDYNDRCRLCIAGAKRLSIDIFSPEGKRSKLQAKISKYLSLKISEDDKLPSAICYQCLFRLETWVSFKKHCSDSDQTLKNWAFFCGAITPESYLIEANKSSENGSDIEKPSYFPCKDDARKHRTPPAAHKSAPGPSRTPSRTASPSPSAPLSSSSSTSSHPTSSHRRESETLDKSKTSEPSPLNGLTRASGIRPSGIRPSKSGRRKILRPTKATALSSRDDDSPEQLVTQSVVTQSVDRKANKKSEEVSSPKEASQKQTSPSSLTLPFKRKRGRPSKAWLRERAEALQKLKEAQMQQPSPEKEQERKDADQESKLRQEPKQDSREFKKEAIDAELKEESKEPKPSKSKGLTEMIELDDPDFGSMKFTLSVIDSSAVPSSEKTLVYPESSTSVSSGRLSADSCLKEEFSGFPNVKAQDETKDKVVVDDRLSEPCASEGVSDNSGMPVSPEKAERKRSHSALGHRSSEEGEEGEPKMMKVDATSRSLESLKADDMAAAIVPLPRPLPRPSPSPPRSPPSPSPSPSPDQQEDRLKTEEEEESDAGEVTGDETNLEESYVQEGGPLEEYSDSDNGPPMSPLSPARIQFQVIELGEVQEEVEIDQSDDLEY